MRLCDFPILTFDTYGTLIDWETGIWDALQPLCSRLDDPPTRETALAAFAQVESALAACGRQRYVPLISWKSFLVEIESL